ncbi:MAG: DNA mismatch repair protein MutS [Deltaproteobacteria bacterium]|nr:DNA mismatch repair protein MutS [Deltaproteobacteria bacterium]
MRQYLDVKVRYPDAIVFFRLGDFYEMFYEDAVYVAGALNLTLTTRDKGKEDPVPMCGIPYHAARGYLAKLTDLGHRIAICEQLEDPRAVRGIVRRDVVRVVTPGVILDEESLDPRAPNHVAAVVGDLRRGFGLAFLDVTTGSFCATEAPTLEALLDELARAEPRELVVGTGETDLAAAVRRGYPRVVQTVLKDAAASAAAGDRGTRVLAEALGATWDATLVERAPMAIAAAAAVLVYARATQPAASLPLAPLEVFRRSETLILDAQARAHLELVESLLDRKRQGSLIDVVDQTRSAMGGRLLRRWLLFPLIDVARIRRRQDAVERLVNAHAARDASRAVLGEIGDLERLVGRARLGVASPRDMVALGTGLARLPEIAAALSDAAAGEILTTVNVTGRRAGAVAEPAADRGDGGADLGGDLGGDLGSDLGSDISRRILDTLRLDAPANTKLGGMVRPGFSAELDELVEIAAGGRAGLAVIEARERERTGISSLKVKYNSVFGYYIEVTRAQLERVPGDYVRKQTVANAERFVTPELADYESKILSANERRIAIETEVFNALREEVGRAAERLLALAGRVATVDVVAALAEVAHRNNYCRPVVDDSRLLDITDGRHPVVERFAATAGGFVPNDIRLDPESEQILIVTGPNMAGKSTVIRQVALTVIMAQMGGYVPARAAHIGVCDRVFTRVGAGDNLARGESTFLVEMKETAHILRYATERSLVILDEIGRGTSTYDGVSIAWAVAEHLHDNLRAKTLFATHYHELCALVDTHPRVRNVSVAAREWQGEVVFLRKLTPGGTSRSFGIDVAKIAGMPPAVVARAREILSSLESGEGRAVGQPDARSEKDGGPRVALPGDAAGPQLGLFAGAPSTPLPPQGISEMTEVVAALRALDPDGLTPRQALDVLVALKNKLT